MPDDFASHFCRNHDGSWTCVSPGALEGPNGQFEVTQGSRFYPGTRFMGFDIARWLEAQIGGRAGSCG